MFLKYINIPLFLVSLAFGLFFVYMIHSPVKEIQVFPTPENINKLQYKDHTDTCFEYEMNEVKCPTDESKIKDYRVQ